MRRCLSSLVPLLILLPFAESYLNARLSPHGRTVKDEDAISTLFAADEGGGPSGGGRSTRFVERAGLAERAAKIIPTTRSVATFAIMKGMAKNGRNKFPIRLLQEDKNYVEMDQRNRAFTRLLLTTTERRIGQIDKVINQFIKKPFVVKNGITALCMATMRVATAQILFLDIPEYAILKESVDVLRKHPTVAVPQAKVRFVNAILRSITRDSQSALEKTSILDNLDPWLMNELTDAYGEDRLKKIAEAYMSCAPNFITVNQLPSSTLEERQEKIESVRQQFGDESAVLLPHGSIVVPANYGGAISGWPLYDDGEWWIQDASAAVPAMALYNTLSASNSEKGCSQLHVADLCSAPGGKTAQLCSYNFGKVTAVEISPKRTKSLRTNLERLKMTDLCEVMEGDARNWHPSTPVHGVLVDAPCSATGIGRRQPDIIRRKPDLSELLTTQRELVCHAVDNILEVGGIMVYATCSLLRQEGEEQMVWLLSRTDGAKVESVPFQPGDIPGFDNAIDENGWIRIVPSALPGHLEHCDGFFVAQMRKIS